MDWFLSMLVIYGNFLLGRKKKRGWLVLGVGALCWIYYALTLNPPQYGLIPASVVNLIICSFSFYGWSRRS